MMQFSSKGQFGKGLYFAEEPGYSHFYTTKGKEHLAPDEREFMLADVLMGEIVEMDRDLSEGMRVACNNLVVPPYQNAPGLEKPDGQVARCTRDPGRAGVNPRFNT